MPRSSYADTFNHDDDAAGYDADVRNETDPIRAGYGALLDWVAVRAHGAVLDLGVGTGNLLIRVRAASAVAVDVSANMLALAQAKRYAQPVSWRQDDLLACLDGLPAASFDSVISTYAIHHLTDAEKDLLLDGVHRILRPGGSATFGDLMFETASRRDQVIAELRSAGHQDAADGAQEEFFWDLARAAGRLETLGFGVARRRFSLLSFGLHATRGGNKP